LGVLEIFTLNYNLKMPDYSLPPGSKGTIPVADAAEQTANWRAYLAGSDLVTKAFTFSILSFNNLLRDNPDADGIRVYLGLKIAGDPTSLTALLVPVIDGGDVVTVTTPGGGYGDGDDDNVYNYSQPCPPTCDRDSPLT
jgi:hypothetical protein